MVYLSLLECCICMMDLFCILRCTLRNLVEVQVHHHGWFNTSDTSYFVPVTFILKKVSMVFFWGTIHTKKDVYVTECTVRVMTRNTPVCTRLGRGWQCYPLEWVVVCLHLKWPLVWLSYSNVQRILFYCYERKEIAKLMEETLIVLISYFFHSMWIEEGGGFHGGDLITYFTLPSLYVPNFVLMMYNNYVLQ